MPPTVSTALQHATALGLERLDAQWLLLHALHPHASASGQTPDRAWLVAHGDDVLASDVHTGFAAFTTRRLQGEPLAYITGWHEFHGLRLQLTRDVLVPRPDTETLVDWALACAQDFGGPGPHQALDLGTGSGAIALAFQHARADWRVTATDASAAALAVAQRNADAHGLTIQFFRGNWFESIKNIQNNNKNAIESIPEYQNNLTEKTHIFRLIFSNPPYIAENDPHLPALRFEPRQALTSGAEGLDDLRHLIQAAPEHLAAGGWLLLEHGHDQAAPVRALLQARGFAEVQSRRDLGGHWRCSGGKMPA